MPRSKRTRVTWLLLVGGIWWSLCHTGSAAQNPSGVSSPPASTGAPRQPNIILILADDLGWSDLGCYGNPWHETPHLDRLAGEGMRFTSAYAPAPICSASRAAILTGRSPARLHFEFVTKERPGRQKDELPLKSPDYTLDLPLEETTIAEALQPAGYRTGFFGKWHVSRHHGGYLGWSPTHGPRQQGFAAGEREFGSHPYGYPKNEKRGFGAFASGEYPPDALTDRAIEFLRRNRERPFLLILSHYYVHTPVHTRLKWLYDKYRARLPPGADDRRAAYAAMVETLDHEVGRVLQALDELRLAENTLVVFTSDNGGHPEFTANGPLRGSKWTLYEGGIRVPFFVRWPGVVPAAATSREPVVGSDLFPTFCELVGAPVRDAQPRDGRSLVSLWRGEPEVGPVRPLIWHFPYYHPETGFARARARIGIDDFAVPRTRPQSAIRLGDYKLVLFEEDAGTELYRLSVDPGEQHDLSAQEPARVRELQRQLHDYLESVSARRAVKRAPGAAVLRSP